jgi:hypothetical protein
LVFAIALLFGHGTDLFGQAANAMQAAGAWHPTEPDFDSKLVTQLYAVLRTTRYYTVNPTYFAHLKDALSESAQMETACK